MKRTFALILASATALTSAGPSLAADVEINYWMWDGQQSPVYQQCATAFEAANPGIKIKITQDGWGNYWTSLTTSFVSGGAPDVFVNHVSRYPEQASSGQLLDLTPLIEADKFDMGVFQAGLSDAWSKDGKQWGIPKDWDTIALVYSKQAVADAGIKEDDLKSMTWNPDDGGTFGQIVAKLAVDANGKRGDDPAYDKANVKQYGFLSIAGSDGFGQSSWSAFAQSAGFKYIDKSFGSVFYYDNPILAKTLTYLRDLALVKGVSISLEQAGNLEGGALFAAGKVAMTEAGSWEISSKGATAPGPYGYAPLPTGPEGRRSMRNGLADTISATTQHPAEAWKWVQYLGSAACQDVVGQSGVVFPAIQSGTDAAIKAHQANGVDVTPFTDVATAETTFAFPLSDYGNQVNDIFKGAVERVLLNQGDPAETLKAANDEVNALFK